LPVVLLANKCDAEGAVVDGPALTKFCEANGFTAWFETSAKTDHKIDAACRFLVENILSHEDIFADKARKRAEAAGGGALRPPGAVTPGGAQQQQSAFAEGGCC